MSKVKIERGSDNVFSDLGFADAESHKLKAELVARMLQIVRDRKITQVQTALLLGLSQPDVSRLMRGQFKAFSAERIMRLLTKLGCEVDITVRPQGSQTSLPAIHLQAIPY